MKTFIVSMVLFITMMTLIIVNSLYVNQTANTIMQMTTSLPAPGCLDYSGRITSMERLWEQHYSLLNLTVSLNDLNKVADCISQLKAYSVNDNEQDFESTRQLLVNAIKNLHRLEKLSLDSIM